MTAIGRIILAGAVLSLLGCGPSFTLEGTWIGYRNVQVQPGTDPVLAKNLSKVQITIDKKGRFELFERGVPKSGFVEYGDDVAHLDVQESMMTDIRPEVMKEFEGITLTRSGEGGVIFRQPGVENTPVELVREIP